MNIGILLPGFSSDENDWAIPVQLNLVREMAQHDDVRVLALRYPHRRDCYPIFGSTVCSLGVGQARGSKRLALWWDALRTLRRLHRQKPFDVLHAMWADETGLIAAWAGRMLGVPSVVSIAGGELARLDDIGYGLQRSAFSRWIVGQALTGTSRVIAACSYTRRLIPQAGYHVPEERIRTITLGVDMALFTKEKRLNTEKARKERGSRNRGAEKAELIHVASLVGVKDQAMLLRAVSKLDGVRLNILGTGPEQPKLESLARDLNIAGRVHFAGAVAHQKTPEYYRRSALNVLSSRHEGLGMVTLEASACGVPTVSTAVGLLPDVPALGVSVPVGDDAALAAAINDLLSHPEKREAIGQSAYETVRSRYTIQHTAEHFRALYKEL